MFPLFPQNVAAGRSFLVVERRHDNGSFPSRIQASLRRANFPLWGIFPQLHPIPPEFSPADKTHSVQRKLPISGPALVSPLFPEGALCPQREPTQPQLGQTEEPVFATVPEPRGPPQAPDDPEAPLSSSSWVHPQQSSTPPITGGGPPSPPGWEATRRQVPGVPGSGQPVGDFCDASSDGHRSGGGDGVTRGRVWGALIFAPEFPGPLENPGGQST